MPLTATGVLELEDALPIWPEEPTPQHLMVLFESVAQA
jgi:hypothetical protein